MADPLRLVPITCLSPHGAGFLVEEIDSSGIAGEQLDNLQHGEMENLFQIERLVEGDRDIVQGIKFTVAAPDFVFRLLLFG